MTHKKAISKKDPKKILFIQVSQVCEIFDIWSPTASHRVYLPCPQQKKKAASQFATLPMRYEPSWYKTQEGNNCISSIRKRGSNSVNGTFALMRIL